MNRGDTGGFEVKNHANEHHFLGHLVGTWPCLQTNRGCEKKLDVVRKWENSLLEIGVGLVV